MAPYCFGKNIVAYAQWSCSMQNCTCNSI